MHKGILFVLLFLLGAPGQSTAQRLPNPPAREEADTLEVERREQEPVLETSHRKFRSSRGKPIARIRVRTHQVFGATLADTSRADRSRFERFLNNLNFTTRDATVRRNLLFREGDLLDPFRLADSERVLRNLGFIGDARILVSSGRVRDSVDVLVIVKDAWTLNLSGRLLEQNGVRVSLAEQNLMGLGHGVSVAATVLPNETQKLGYHADYSVQNIGGSFITGGLKFADMPAEASAGLALSRELVSPVLRYAGGLDLKRVRIDVAEDSLLTVADNTSNLIDLWAGRPIRIPLVSQEIDRRRFLFVSARALYLDFTRRPPVTRTTFPQYHDINYYLGSLAFIQSRFYRTNLLYNFGRTEDVPYGFVAQMTYGVAGAEFARRTYAAAVVAAGRQYDRLGYGAVALRIGGHPGGGRIDDGALRLQTLYFSNLFHSGRFRFRQFVQAEYVTGIRRLPDDSIDFSRHESIRGITYNHRVTGSERLLLSLENVAFTPWRTQGVSVALFTFADLDVIGSGRGSLLGQEYYSGLGLGVRLRRDAWGIGPLQLRFAWYPRLPVDHEAYVVSGYGEKRFEPIEFLSTQPEIVEY